MDLSEFMVRPAWSTEQVLGEPSLGSGTQKALECIAEQGGHVSALASSRTGQLRSHGSDFRIKDRRKELWNKAVEARCVSGMSLNGGLAERPFHGAVKVKPGLPWRPQGVRDTCRGQLLTGSGTDPRERSVL